MIHHSGSSFPIYPLKQEDLTPNVLAKRLYSWWGASRFGKISLGSNKSNDLGYFDGNQVYLKAQGIASLIEVFPDYSLVLKVPRANVTESFVRGLENELLNRISRTGQLKKSKARRIFDLSGLEVNSCNFDLRADNVNGVSIMLPVREVPFTEKNNFSDQLFDLHRDLIYAPTHRYISTH